MTNFREIVLLLLVLMSIVNSLPANDKHSQRKHNRKHTMVCIIEGGVGVYKPHPLNCNAYYQCDNNQFVEKFCPSDLYWNPELNICDWKDNVDCENDTEEPVSLTNPSKCSSSSSDSSSSSFSSSSLSLSCSESITSTTTTGTTTIDVPTTTTEMSSTITEPSSTTIETSSTTIQISTTTESPSTTVRPPFNFLCPNQNSFTKFHPHPDCRRFYEETNYFVVDRACPEWYHWNNRENCCDDPNKANCIFGQAPLRPDAIPETTNAPTSTITLPESSPSFSTTTKSSPTTESFTTTESSSTTETPSTVTPPFNLFCPNQNLYTEFHAHPDCRRFYEELCEVVIDRSCPEGYNWNNRENCCDNPTSADCVFGQAPLRPDAIPEVPWTTTISEKTSPITESTTTAISEYEDDEFDQIYICPNNNPMLYLFPHPDCERFYSIQIEVTFDIRCPVGLHFDPREKCCGEPYLVKCIFGSAPWRPDAIVL